MELQMGITFKPKGQFEWFFLHIAPYNMYFPSIPSFGMKSYLHGIGSFMKIFGKIS
jgi:hypothetical protein